MRIVFAGSPAIAVPTLLAVASEHTIVAVLTNPPSAKGRKGTLEPTPVGAAAETLLQSGGDFPILTPDKLDQNLRESVAACKPDILVCFAYGKIFGPKFMALFPRGGINMHPSLLPLYRGATPIPSAILGRETETGFTVQVIAAEMDSGDVILQERYPLSESETTESLSQVAAQHGATLICTALRQIENGNATFTPQKHECATYCGKITKDMGKICWTDSASVINARIRAYTPWPGSFSTVIDDAGNTRTLIIHQAQVATALPELLNGEPGTIAAADRRNGILVRTGDGLLQLTVLQWQTKKAVDWKSFLNGTPNCTALRFID